MVTPSVLENCLLTNIDALWAMFLPATYVIIVDNIVESEFLSKYGTVWQVNSINSQKK